MKIEHIGIAVRNLESALRLYRDALGFRLDRIEEVADQGVRVAMLSAGESRLELLEATRHDSPVAGFIARRGEGVHHICFQVDDIAAELKKLEEAGIRLVDRTPRVGAGGRLVAFLHPSAAGGVLIELSQKPGEPPASGLE